MLRILLVGELIGLFLVELLQLVKKVFLVLELGVDRVQRVPHLVGDRGIDVGHVLPLCVEVVHQDLLGEVDKLDGDLRVISI